MKLKNNVSSFNLNYRIRSKHQNTILYLFILTFLQAT